ncbi:MAG: nitronate monooxygenase [Alphaproteobacteria bacterium]|nr:nitronate monooxygenase [Alphaproteobacteria bacterium]
MNSTGLKRLETLWKRGKEFLGTDYAILGGAMSWVSERHLVSSTSNAGGFGVIACGSMTPKLLEAEIMATQALTTKPFGVNLITMHPDLEALIHVCIDRSVSHVVLAGGLPRSQHISLLKNANIKVIGFAPALAIGKKLIKDGVDALIIEGMEAGGHIGPVATSVLAQEILPELGQKVPIFVAGGIGRGEAMVSYLEMGASGCQIGTLLVCASESIAHTNFKRAFIKANARDAIPSIQIDPEFPVIPVRAITNNASRRFMEFQLQTIKDFKEGKFTKPEAQLAIEHFWAGALRKAVIEGDIENGSLMAGQSVGMVSKEQPVVDILNELINQAVLHLEIPYDTRP